jgi:hypothetical protein
MIKHQTAAVCYTSWTVEGSEANGRAMTNRNIKLVLCAFNGECNSLIAKVKWNNVNQMKERISKSYCALNRLGKSSTICIQEEYLDLKVKEITLEHEFQLKRQREKELYLWHNKQNEDIFMLFLTLALLVKTYIK